MIKQAVILAGGKGTRLLPLTQAIPKPMVHIAGFPFLYWQLRYLREQGVSEVILLVSHLASVVKEYFQRKPMDGLKISYSVEKSPMGTGGALRNALPLLPEQFWLLNGDSFLFLDLPRMANAHHKLGVEASMVVAEAQVIGVPGNVLLEGDRVVEYRRDAGFPHVDAGVYLLHRALVASGPTGEFDLGALWPPVMGRRGLGAFMAEERFFDIGTLERLKIFEQHVGEYF